MKLSSVSPCCPGNWHADGKALASRSHGANVYSVVVYFVCFLQAECIFRRCCELGVIAVSVPTCTHGTVAFVGTAAGFGDVSTWDSSVGVCWCVLSTFCHLSLGGIYAFAFILSYPLRFFAGPPPFPTCSTGSLCEIFELARHVCVLSNGSCYVLLFFPREIKGVAVAHCCRALRLLTLIHCGRRPQCKFCLTSPDVVRQNKCVYLETSIKKDINLEGERINVAWEHVSTQQALLAKLGPPRHFMQPIKWKFSLSLSSTEWDITACGSYISPITMAWGSGEPQRCCSPQSLGNLTPKVQV